LVNDELGAAAVVVFVAPHVVVAEFGPGHVVQVKAPYFSHDCGVEIDINVDVVGVFGCVRIGELGKTTSGGKEWLCWQGRITMARMSGNVECGLEGATSNFKASVKSSWVYSSKHRTSPRGRTIVFSTNHSFFFPLTSRAHRESSSPTTFPCRAADHTPRICLSELNTVKRVPIMPCTCRDMAIY
jgi:hypothetical protein